MYYSSRIKMAIGILLVLPAAPFMGLFHSLGAFIIGTIAVAVGMVFLVWGIRQATYKRPELKEFPDDVVINGVHYPKSAFSRVNVFAKGRETVYAIKELRQITGISAEEAKKVVNNWEQYYSS